MTGDQALKISAEFASPFGVLMHGDPQDLNGQLTKLFLDREKQGDQYKNQDYVPTRQVEIFESRWDLFRWPDPPVQRLRKFCMDALQQMILNVSSASEEDLKGFRIYNETWFHITRKGGYIGHHNHANYSWSGVYCVDPGRTSGSESEDADVGGILQFYDPRMGSSMFVDPSNASLKSPFATGISHFRLMPGQLVLFPSFLFHDVSPYTGNGTRITVAFNSRLTDQQGRIF